MNEYEIEEDLDWGGFFLKLLLFGICACFSALGLSLNHEWWKNVLFAVIPFSIYGVITWSERMDLLNPPDKMRIPLMLRLPLLRAEPIQNLWCIYRLIGFTGLFLIALTALGFIQAPKQEP